MLPATVARLQCEDLYGPPLDARGRSLRELKALADERLRRQRAFYLRNFPPDMDLFAEFLSSFGQLLSNYGEKYGLESYSKHPSINVVRYQERDGGDKFVHEQGGELRAHSARSWSKARPAFFSMLMVDPGWLDQESGQNGESISVRWRDVLSLLEAKDAELFARDFQLLTTTPLRFAANHVVEPTSDLPLLYPLADAADRYDLGVRMKVDILSKIEQMRDDVPDYESYREALLRFCEGANDPAVCVSYQMAAGDLVMVDNNRFGHGRLGMVARREAGRRTLLNPRELWSVSLA